MDNAEALTGLLVLAALIVAATQLTDLLGTIISFLGANIWLPIGIGLITLLGLGADYASSSKSVTQTAAEGLGLGAASVPILSHFRGDDSKASELSDTSSSADTGGSNLGNVRGQENSHGEGTMEGEYLSENGNTSTMGIFSSEEENVEAEEQELHELVEELDQQGDITNQKMEIDRELKGELSQLLEDMDDFLQHDQRIKQIAQGDVSVGELLQHQDEIGQDLRAMRGDIKEMHEMFEDVRKKINEKHELVQEDEQNESQQEKLMDELLERQRKTEQMEQKLDKIVDAKIDI